MFKNASIAVTICAVSLLVLAGCGQMRGTSHTNDTAPRQFPSYFKQLTTFGNYDVSNPRLAEGPKDDQFTIVDTHGSVTLDIGQGLSFYSTGGPDITVYMPNDRPANYTVHVRHARHEEANWTEIGRGRGPGDFDLDPYYSGAADFLQIRNEGTEPLYIDAVRALNVRHD